MIEKNWKEIIKPSKLQVKNDVDNHNTATIIAEPLERGYGVTLGNALRRILLSSLQGSAITSMYVQGVLHEFSSIQGVREDLTDIILNVKGIKVKLDYNGEKKINLNVDGPATVIAGMIECPSEVEIMNKLPYQDQFDAVIFAVPHMEYQQVDLLKWINKDTLILDANMVFNDITRKKIQAQGIRLESIGRGNGL